MTYLWEREVLRFVVFLIDNHVLSCFRNILSIPNLICDLKADEISESFLQKRFQSLPTSLQHFDKTPKIHQKISITVADPWILERGGGGPGAVYFLRSGDCVDAPSHIPYALLVA